MPPSPPGTTPPTSPKRSTGGFRDAWSRASWTQKAIIALLPVAFIAIRAASAHREAPHKHIAPAVGPAPSALARAATSPTVAPSSRPIPPLTTAGGKTGARLAADAVAAGAYAEAAVRYDDLARLYPDQPVYRETARILRSKLEAATPSVSSPP